MATARQKGGIASVAGVREIAAYSDYVLGFQTGFNSETPGRHLAAQKNLAAGDDVAISNAPLWRLDRVSASCRRVR